MKKNHFSLLLALLLSMVSTTVLAYDAEIDGVYYNFSEYEASVTYKNTNYNSYSGDVVIPEQVEYDDMYYTVKYIGEYAFTGCSELTSITIPNTVRVIDRYAFYNCSGLTSITIPQGVTDIGINAFFGCSSLTKAEFASIERVCLTAFEHLTSNPLTYAHHLYINGEEVKDLMIPTNITGIAPNAFSGCSGLTSVTIPQSVTAIGSYAFQECSGLTKAEFASVESLCSITFSNETSNPLTYAHHLYINGEEVKDLAIPTNIISIGNYVFSGCSGLTSVTIPQSVTSIGERAFVNCSSLTSVTIPESVTTIRAQAFSGCTGLTSATIGNGVITIGNGAFGGCRGLTSVIIGNSVTSIGDRAFDRCVDLTSVNIPNSVTSIGEEAFYGCKRLTSISIPNNVTSIGGRAFDFCTGLTSITIPNSVTSIGYQAFSGCTGLVSLTIGNGLTELGEDAFIGCSNLTSISIDSGNTTYDSRNNCNAIIETASNTLIQGCNNTIIPDGVTKIDDYAFIELKELTAVIIPNSVTEIGRFSFVNCSGLISIVLGNGVTSIGEYAFNYGESVTVNIASPLTIGPNTFANRTNATLYVPYGSKAAYEEADYWKEFKEIIEMPIPPCTAPVLAFQNGKIRCSCETEGVKYMYTITSTSSGESTDGVIPLGTQFTVSVRATREGYSDSEASVITINMADVGDLNGDGTISIADVTGLVNVILGK